MDDENLPRLPVPDPLLEESFVPLGAEALPGVVVPTSPTWSSITKLVIGLSIVAVSLFLLFRFLDIVGPLVLAFILAYIFHPVAETLRKYTHLPWRLAVTLLYLILVIIMLGSLTAGGVAIVQQIQSLISFLEKTVTDLPATVQSLLTTPFAVGPFAFKLNALNMDVNTIVQQVMGVVQPTLTTAGTLVGSFATGAAGALAWGVFILLISYFILAESRHFPNLLTSLSLPGYTEDMLRLSKELSRIWNAFLRGQLTIVLIVILIYIFLLGAEGVHFFYGLALLAGMSRFVPFVGPAIAWTTYGLVAYFQGTTIFGLPPLGYVALVVGSAWFTDLLIDNLFSPRIMAQALRVHPATVMVSALIGVNLLGIIGVVLAAPVLATVQLFFNYILSKLTDQNPWLNLQTFAPARPLRTLHPEALRTDMQKEIQEIRLRVSKRRFPWLH